MDKHNKSESSEGHTDSPSDARPMQTRAAATFFDDGFRENLGRYSVAQGGLPASLLQGHFSVGEAFQAVAPLAASRQAPSSDVHQIDTHHHQFAQDGIDFAGYCTTLQADGPAVTDAQSHFQDNNFGWGATGGEGEPLVSTQSVNLTREQRGLEPVLLPHLGTVGPWSSAYPPVNHTTSHPAEPSSQLLSVMPGEPATSYAAFPLGSVAAPNQTQVSESPVGTSVATLPSETEGTNDRADHSVSVVQPQDWDILYGRGKQHRKHPGNKRMKLLIDLHRDAYSKADRIAKTDMSKEIVKIIKSSGDKSGRFLRFDKKVNGWVEVSDESAREKISHAMRDGKTRPLERIDPKVLDEIPLLSDHIKQDALRKVFESKRSGESSSPSGEQFNLLDDPFYGQGHSKQEEMYRKRG